MRADQFLYVNYVLQYVNGHADRLQKKNMQILFRIRSLLVKHQIDRR